MAAAGGNPALMPLQNQAQAKLFPGGLFMPVVTPEAAHDKMALILHKIEQQENKIRTNPNYGVGSRQHQVLDAEVWVL